MSHAIVLIIGGFLLSAALAVCGIIFLFNERTVYDTDGKTIEIEVPMFGKLKTNFPAIAALFLAAGLAAYTLHMGFRLPDRFAINTSVSVEGLEPSAATDIIVGIIPGSYMFVNTLRGGSTSLSRDIYVASGEHSYMGVAFMRRRDGTLLEVGSVTVDGGNHSFNAKLRAKP